MLQVLLPYVLTLIVNGNNEVLLDYRQNTQWFNNHYGLIGGQIEDKESAKKALAREVFEEIKITFEEQDAEFAHVMHFMGINKPCIALFYTVKKWSGNITNKEENKHTELKWFPIDKLPDNIIPRHKKAIELALKGISYSEDNW